VELVSERISLHRGIRGHTECDMLSTKSSSTNPIKIIVVPGNPGLIEFYIEFIKTLYTNLNGQYDIIGVSHLGHCGQIQEQFTVEEQIEHKAIFLEHLRDKRYGSIKDGVKFVLIGHSVGSYVSIKLVSRYSDQFNFVKKINLFPTFRDLYDGLSPFIKVAIQNRWRWGVASFLHYVPSFVLNGVLSTILPTDDMRVALQYKLNYWTALNILFMAHSETLDIRHLDDECKKVFNTRMDDLLFIYGLTDPYTPHRFHDDLVADYPAGNIEYAAPGVPHAFVLTHSTLVANRVSEWLSQSLESK
ncbi:hypothetical protein SAMD00019534_092050, partial [Acytostelium subglobosum LB1]|uniref:hypothetical protein n=1 Tax=Acytostelium subglobosum LB1 TaxID=1410327 RepID=UPI000644A536